MHGRVEDRLGARHAAVHLDLGKGGALEPFDQYDVGAGEVAPASVMGSSSSRARSNSTRWPGASISTRSALPRASGATCPCPAGPCRGVRPCLMVITRNLPARQLRGQRDQKRRLARVLETDDRDHPRRRHTTSARSRSSGVFTLKNRSSGSPKRPHLREENTDPHVAVEGDGFESPASMRRSIAPRRRSVHRAQRLHTAAVVLSGRTRPTPPSPAPGRATALRARTACPTPRTGRARHRRRPRVDPAQAAAIGPASAMVVSRSARPGVRPRGDEEGGAPSRRHGLDDAVEMRRRRRRAGPWRPP